MKQVLGLALAASLVMPLAAYGAPAPNPDFRTRTPEQEVIYFVLPDRFDNGDPANDRGGLSGDRLVTGF
ncbi:MAG: alpha-amylase, partial [Sphingomonadales bacterium]|nr:alpha-amylase [Sphingomonadales bacterium]